MQWHVPGPHQGEGLQCALGAAATDVGQAGGQRVTAGAGGGGQGRAVDGVPQLESGTHAGGEGEAHQLSRGGVRVGCGVNDV